MSLVYNTSTSVYNSTCISTLLLCERLYVFLFCTRNHFLLIVSCVCTNKSINIYLPCDPNSDSISVHLLQRHVSIVEYITMVPYFWQTYIIIHTGT